MMVKATGLSQTGVVRICHAHGLLPRRAETLGLAADLLLIQKVRGGGMS